MRLNPNDFRTTLNDVRLELISPRHPPERRCSEISVNTHVPLLAVVLYALRPDVLGEVPRLREMVTTLTKFYRYLDVSPWSDETPALPQQLE